MVDRSPYRDAIRILFILIKGSEDLLTPDPTGAVAIFRGEAKLHAFDFWMRNPDYLADELLNKFEQDGNEKFLEEVEKIFADEEPDIRRVPMLRYRFGAYERLDDTVSLLRSRDLVRITGVKSGDKVRETHFLIMPSAIHLAASIIAEFPVLGWYAIRSELVAEIAKGLGGKALKEKQYLQVEYAETQFGGVIPAISSRVRARFELLKAEH